MFISTLFTLALSCPTPKPGGPPGFAAASLCEAAAQPIARALRPAGGGQALGSCHPVAAPREALAMTDKTESQTAAEADRTGRERLDAEIAAALVRHGVLMVDSRPGFAARRRDRMLHPRQTRED